MSILSALPQFGNVAEYDARCVVRQLSLMMRAKVSFVEDHRIIMSQRVRQILLQQTIPLLEGCVHGKVIVALGRSEVAP